MALSEEQIQLYARQILLKPVGGRGQEKLCAAKPLLLGHGPALEVARIYLKAGGTTLEGTAAPGAVVGASVQWSDCTDCLTEAAAKIAPASDDTATLAGTVAALAIQRLVLEIGPRDGRLELKPDGSCEPIAAIRCSGHR
jgi:hypothetical protein